MKFTYTQALNGIAVVLTRAEALKVSRVPGVTSVQVDRLRTIQTDVGPESIGAPSVWSGASDPGEGGGTKGEGIIAGIIDSGLNPANPSFAATVPESQGGDGFVIQNPRSKYYGVCDSTRAGQATNPYNPTWGCNDKLIGYWDYTGKGQTYDDDGHGSHTGSTTVGNQVTVTTHSNEGSPNDFSWTGKISGVAPHANLIGYDVCYPVAGGQTSCSEAAIVAAINQAIADKVDVINYSIGGSSPSSPWNDTDTTGFLNARAAGIHVAVSAGNDGPGDATISGPADAPWLTAVGASTHNRQWQARGAGHHRTRRVLAARPHRSRVRQGHRRRQAAHLRRRPSTTTRSASRVASAPRRARSPARSWSATAATTVVSRRARSSPTSAQPA